jgi:hypothetical protein
VSAELLALADGRSPSQDTQNLVPLTRAVNLTMRLPRSVGFVLVVIAALIASRASAQQSYSLVCRGGPAMRLTPEVSIGVTSAGSAVVKFTRGGRGAVHGVDPGTCAWQDRGISGAEPAALCFARVDLVSLEISGAREVAWLRVRAWVGSQPGIFWEGGERPDGAAFRLSDSGEHWYFRAYNDATRGCLLVTHIGT